MALDIYVIRLVGITWRALPVHSWVFEYPVEKVTDTLGVSHVMIITKKQKQLGADR